MALAGPHSEEGWSTRTMPVRSTSMPSSSKGSVVLERTLACSRAHSILQKVGSITYQYLFISPSFLLTHALISSEYTKHRPQVLNALLRIQSHAIADTHRALAQDANVYPAPARVNRL